MREVKSKVLVMAVALMAVAMLATHFVGTVMATKSETIEGTFTMLPTFPPPFPEASVRPCGKSDMAILTWTNLAVNVEGDMEGTGVYNGFWICVWGMGVPATVRSAHGEYILDVTIEELSGQLMLDIDKGNLVIISGTGDLKNLHGTGSLEGVSGVVYAYSIDVHFDP